MAKFFVLPTIWLLQLLASAVALLPLLALYLYERFSGKPRSTYNWKPDLTHDVHLNNNDSWAGGHMTITTTPKTQEQIHEEKRAYLKERQK